MEGTCAEWGGVVLAALSADGMGLTSQVPWVSLQDLTLQRYHWLSPGLQRAA